LNWVNSKQVIGTVWGDFGVGTTIYVPYQYIWCIPCLKHRIYSVNTRFWPTCKPLYASYHTSYILPYTYTYCRIHTAVYIITYRASNAYHVHPRMHHTIHSIICMPCTPSYASYHTQHHMHAMYTIVCIIPYTASYACHVHCTPSYASYHIEKKENYAGSKTLPESIKEKETHWPEVP